MEEKKKPNGCITVVSIIFILILIGLLVNYFINSNLELKQLQREGEILEAEHNSLSQATASILSDEVVTTEPIVDVVKMDAYLATRDFISNKLSIPSGTNYQPYADDLISVLDVKDEGKMYSMSLWVDVQSGLGTINRITFSVIVRQKLGKWELIMINDNIK